MIEVRRTAVFQKWTERLRDRNALARINMRIARLELGNAGDAKSVGEGVRELRIDYGPGYRVYFIEREKVVAILLCGGDKSTQSADIDQAKKLAKEV
jgi:putative addiction module killer protein